MLFGWYLGLYFGFFTLETISGGICDAFRMVSQIIFRIFLLRKLFRVVFVMHFGFLDAGEKK